MLTGSRRAKAAVASWWRIGRGQLATIVFGAVLLLATPLAQAEEDDRLISLTRQVKELRHNDRYPEAVDAGSRAVELAESVVLHRTNDAILAIQEHAFTLMMLARYAEADGLYRRALAIARAADAKHPFIGTSLAYLARVNEGLGKTAEAEGFLKDNIANLQGVLGSTDAYLAIPIEALAEFYERQGRLGEAERERHRLLALVEAALGPQHTRTAAELRGVARLTLLQGRPAEAEPLLRRALAIGESAFGVEYPLLAGHRADLASALLALDRASEALPFARMAGDGMKRVLGINHGQTADTLRVLGRTEHELGLLSEAEATYREALVFFEKNGATRHIGYSRGLAGIADVLERQHRWREAAELRQQVLAITEAVLSKEHAETARANAALGSLYFDTQDWAKAVHHYRAAVDVQRRLEGRAVEASEANARGGVGAQTSRPSENHLAIVRSLSRLYAAGLIGAVEATSESFISAQGVAISMASEAVAQMASRQANGLDGLSQLVRERQDLATEWRRRSQLLLAAAAKPPADRNDETEGALRKRLAAIDGRIGEIDRNLRTAVPKYAALAIPKPLTIEEVQALIADDEALVLFLDAPRWSTVDEEAFVWVVTRAASRWVRIDKLGSSGLIREVAALRCGLDAGSWRGEGAKRCGGLLDLRPANWPRDSDSLPFDAARAHTLYKALLGEVADLIVGKSLLVVPSGALTRLPFQVLVTEAPTSSNLAKAHWLIRDHALTVLPAVSALQALRYSRHAKVRTADRLMIGFGNPTLDGDPKNALDRLRAEAAAYRQDCALPLSVAEQLLRKRASLTADRPASLAGNASATSIRQLEAVPATAYLLCDLAADPEFADSVVRLGRSATKRAVKDLSRSGDLARYFIVHFATHGLLPDGAKARLEPGLVLTPTDGEDGDSTGYLTASEIAELSLDADLVVLSACNTAGAEKAGGEALSGLARAFIYAGARALVVSHWSVYEQAAVELIASMLKLTRQSGVGLAEAQKRSIASMLDNGDRRKAHPAYWAPFVVVGEGGAAR